MGVKVKALALMWVVVVVVAGIQIHEAEAFGNCLINCQDACQKMKPDPNACALGCFDLCQVDQDTSVGMDRRLLMKVAKVKGKPNLDWIKH